MGISPRHPDHDAELPALGIVVTPLTPLAVIVSAMRRAGVKGDMTKMRRLADRYRYAPKRPAEVELVATVDESATETSDRSSLNEEINDRPVVERSSVDSKAVREWAARNGVDCPRTGRVPERVLAQYQAAMALVDKEQARESLVPVEGGEPMPAEPPEESGY